MWEIKRRWLLICGIVEVVFWDINFKDVKVGKLFFMVGFKKMGDYIWVNFG